MQELGSCKNKFLFYPSHQKRNDSPACRPKTSNRCHTQQHNLQQRFSVAALVSRSSYLLPSLPCQILQMACPPLVAPLHPSCLVGCCVIARWPPSTSLPAPPLLVAHASARRRHLLLCRGTTLVQLVALLPDGLPPPLCGRLCLLSFVGCHVVLHHFACLAPQPHSPSHHTSAYPCGHIIWLVVMLH